MKPRGMLMTEHRLIEKMIDIIQAETLKIQKGKVLDEFLINSVVDFMRFYADATHHGKEEDILFSMLENKDMSSEDSKLMNDLIEEHRFARHATEDIIRAEKLYFQGEDTIGIIITTFNAFAVFYPKHVQKEEENFFPNSEIYFSEQELESMIRKFHDFDKGMIHKKYKSLVEDLQNK
ncbi:MAG: hemerythrin domain-containing protein [Phycisphaerales bacterium]